MITMEEHLRAVLALAAAPPTVTVPLADALGLVLAEPPIAAMGVPAFTNSAMDGFAVRAADVGRPGVTLPVSGDAPAGSAPGVLAPGTAVRIMTGAPIPDGADAVVPVEQTDHRAGVQEAPATVTFATAAVAASFVRPAGTDLTAGATVGRRGERVSPALVAGLVATGVTQVSVHPRPRVAVVTTGDELVAPGEHPGPGQVPDTNGPLLAALVQQQGAACVARLRTPDERAAFTTALERAADVADLVITAGGVSAGAFEVVRQVTGGSAARFVQVAMQPGKPQGLGRVGAPGTPLLAFPGNPVSAFVSFVMFGAPLLARLAGADPRLVTVEARAASGWHSPRGRAQVMPVVWTAAAGTCRPAHGLGSASHSTASLHLANALALVGADVVGVRPGDTIRVVPLPARTIEEES